MFRMRAGGVLIPATTFQDGFFSPVLARRTAYLSELHSTTCRAAQYGCAAHCGPAAL
jgi:hypothetical protein